ncbi:hypothetical protein HOY34_12605 [Xinfangfangia sp. D13-10-4-6]|uniref:carboxymuconolactone decarboxylase family protein n=1 Tax=Pseudogemmobacter hezensis TaxID=2737662 RepID=UPI00155616B4|nr:carboxymuconolactone decarboxylase family protein [Pseudogemmobacter hezensis]NPD16040.1 hypothetical protein [Pseudogemmobacter hezensis]
MAETTRPSRFAMTGLAWQTWQSGGLAGSISDSESGPAPFLPLALHQPRPKTTAADQIQQTQADALTAAQAALARRRGPGLSLGERDLVATAVARRIGCIFTAATHARRAAQGLRRKREVELLLEEGLPCPLTGRLGAEIDAASALSAVPARTSNRLFWRLEEEKLDDQEIVDLILTAAYSNWNARLALAAGQSLQI